MLYKRTCALLLSLALLAPFALAQTDAKPSVPDVERLREHVTYLASDKLEGRRTGTPGAQEAARYVAEEFRRYGLEPGGDSSNVARVGRVRVEGVRATSYEQSFPYVAGVELGEGNALTATRRADATGGAPLAVDFKV